MEVIRIMLQDLRIYIQEVIDFLDTLVIKYDYFVTLVNDDLRYIDLPGYIDNDPITHPYYRILSGDSTLATEPIYAYSPNDNSDILLTKNVVTNTNMLRFYISSTVNMNTLMSKYPNDQFLIKCIFDPVTDIPSAITAKNLSLLRTSTMYDDSSGTDMTDTIIFLENFLEAFEYRWYINVFEYEDLYPIAYWATLWYLLPIVLLTKRILDVKTDNVHPFHIWEYLTSAGFGSYKGYFSRKQELFLYKNIDYLKHNVGKDFILDILGDIFLKPIRYSLTDKVILAHTEDRADTYDKVPEVLSKYGDDIDYNTYDSFGTLLSEIHGSNLDMNNDPVYLDNILTRFKKSPSNMLATKFIELIQMQSMNKAMLLYRFILDTIVYLVSVDRVNYSVIIKSSVSDLTTESLSVVDALNLFYYLTYVRSGETPVNTFNRYTTSVAITYDHEPTLPTSVYFNENAYTISNYVDLSHVLDDINYVTEPITNVIDMSEILSSQFDSMHKLSTAYETEYDTISALMKYDIIRTIIPETNVLVIDNPHATYDELFNTYPMTASIIDELSDDESILMFMANIFTEIVQLTSGFNSFNEDQNIRDVLVSKLVELFTQMVSYNVTFLTPVVHRLDVYKLPKITASMYDRKTHMSIYGLICGSDEVTIDTHSRMSSEIHVGSDLTPESIYATSTLQVHSVTNLDIHVFYQTRGISITSEGVQVALSI